MPCCASRLQQAALVPASLLLPTIAKLRIVVPVLPSRTWMPIKSNPPDVAVRLSRAPLPSRVRLRRPLRMRAAPRRYVPPALKTIVEPSGAPLMNDWSWLVTLLEPVASIDLGTLRPFDLLLGVISEKGDSDASALDDGADVTGPVVSEAHPTSRAAATTTASAPRAAARWAGARCIRRFVPSPATALDAATGSLG